MSMQWGPVEPRKQVTVNLCSVIVGGGQTAGSVQMRIKNPSSKLRFSIESGVNGGSAGQLVAIDPLGGSNWSLFPVNSTNPPVIGATPVFSALAIPDSFEAVSAGRLFDAFFSLSFLALTGAVNGTSATFAALVTWEPVDPQMSNEERSFWFGLCGAVLTATSAGGTTALVLHTA